jgi:hypothetical protein
VICLAIRATLAHNLNPDPIIEVTRVCEQFNFTVKKRRWTFSQAIATSKNRSDLKT